MITNNKKYTVIAYVIIALILFIGLICFGVKNHKTSKQLSKTQEDLSAAQVNIGNCTESIKEWSEKYNALNDDYVKLNENCVKLNEDLEMANTTIESLSGDKYIVDATVTENEIDMIAKTVWGEARGCDKLQQSAVVWCILNRVDSGCGTIAQVVTAPGQFLGYHKSFPVEDEIKDLVTDVVTRWKLEKTMCGNVGRTLPSDYTYFSANRYGTGNVFRNKFDGDYQVWDWNCWNPYE